jgi:glycosyltransferase involved in cell wall biosynthesis
MRILFVVPYPEGVAPSQRFRFEQYFPTLAEEGVDYTVEPFLDRGTWAILYKPGHTLQKATGILRGFARRVGLLFRVLSYDFVFIHREASPVGPPFFEWFISRVLRKKIIYDFDDAIWLPNTSENNRIAAGLKWHQKVGSICRWAWKVSCGNRYLQEYALQFNPNAIVNPTTIDTEHLHNQVKDQVEKDGPVVIGWTGTHSTLKYLEPLVPVLRQLEEKHEFKFSVISNQAPAFSLRSLVFKPWRKETEIADLLRFNVGVMPLQEDPWAKGKCGFKALQYMALGIPALVSPVGMNTEVVDHGRNGYICQDTADWFRSLELLLKDEALRLKLGAEAREKIISHYSVNSNRDNFLQLFT